MQFNSRSITTPSTHAECMFGFHCSHHCSHTIGMCFQQMTQTSTAHTACLIPRVLSKQEKHCFTERKVQSVNQSHIVFHVLVFLICSWLISLCRLKPNKEQQEVADKNSGQVGRICSCTLEAHSSEMYRKDNDRLLNKGFFMIFFDNEM